MRHSQLVLITEDLWGYRDGSPLDSLLQHLCSACPSMVLLDPLHLWRNLNFDLKPGYSKGFLVSYRTHRTSFSSKECHHHYQKKNIPAAKNIPFSKSFFNLFISFSTSPQRDLKKLTADMP